MGSGIDLISVEIGALAAELTRPTLDQRTVDCRVDGDLDHDLEARWPELASQVAALVAARGGALTVLQSVYVGAVVATVGEEHGWVYPGVFPALTEEHWADWSPDVRAATSARYGDVVNRLVDEERTLLGLIPEMPMIGRMTADEVRAAAASTNAHELSPAAEEELAPLEEAIQHAAPRRYDLISLWYY